MATRKPKELLRNPRPLRDPEKAALDTRDAVADWCCPETDRVMAAIGKLA
jgi:hypothetical protein